MRNLRLAASAAVLAVLVLSAGRAGPAVPERASSLACTPHGLSTAFSGPFTLQSIDNFGCAGAWAFVWATVGTGDHQIGVTEVLRFDASRRSWAMASRLRWCKPGLLPELVYRQGCFSN